MKAEEFITRVVPTLIASIDMLISFYTHENIILTVKLITVVIRLILQLSFYNRFLSVPTLH